MKIDRLSIRERPRGWPIMHQTWGKLLFMHWPIDAALLRPLLPNDLEIDVFEGSAWIGVIPFTMWDVRVPFLPPIPGTSAFHELNVRTYVHHQGAPGVWFFSLDAASKLAIWAARKSYYLPYFFADMSLTQNGHTVSYSSVRQDRRGPPAQFRARWSIGESLPESTVGCLEFFVTERYCLYSENNGRLYRARIHHPPWRLRKATLSSLDSSMIETLELPTPAGQPLLQYAEELKVDIWMIRRVQGG